MIAWSPPLFNRGKDLVAYHVVVRSTIFTSSPASFNQVSTIKKTSIWWCNIKLLWSDRLTEVQIERALNKDIPNELLENRDSQRYDRIVTLIRLAILSLLLALRFVDVRKRDEITTWIGWIWPFFEIFLRFRLVVPFVSKIKSLAIWVLTYIDDAIGNLTYMDDAIDALIYIDDAEKKVDSQMIIVSNDRKIFLIKSNM